MKSILNGPRTKVLFELWKAGIGDVIHCLPTVAQMVLDGYDVTVNANPFVNYLWHSIGVKTMNRKSLLGELWIEQEYGVLLSPNEWNYKAEWKDRFDSFAEEIGAYVPASFSWIDSLKPETIEGEPYTLFAPESTRVCRSLPERRAKEIYSSIPGKKIWLTQGSRLLTVTDWKRVEKIAPEMLYHNTGINSEQELVEKLHEESERLEGRTKCGSVQELLNLVFNASRIVAVESSVSAIASAFAKPLTVHYGATGHKNTIGQFQRYNKGWNYEAIEEPMDEKVLKNSLLGESKLRQIQELVNHNIPGDVAELGVYKGGAARLLAREFPDRNCFFFDTFEGMPFADSSDVHKAGDFSDVSLAHVGQLLSDCENAHFVPGTFPATTEAVQDKTFAFVHVDADQYRSTVDAIEFFWPRLNKGGVIAFDDYLWPKCPGVARALEEFGHTVHSPIPFFAYLIKD